MFLSDLRGQLAQKGHAGSAVARKERGQGSLGGSGDAQLIAYCTAFVRVRARLLAVIARVAVGIPGSSLSRQSRSLIRVDSLDRRMQLIGQRITASHATTVRGLQCKRAVVGLLLAHQQDDPSPLCDNLLLSLLADAEIIPPQMAQDGIALFERHTSEAEYAFDIGEACLAQIEEVTAECIRVGAMPPPQEQERLTVKLYDHLVRTRGLVARMAAFPAGSPLEVQVKGRVLRRLMSIGDADVHDQRLTLARSFVADIASLRSPTDVEAWPSGSGGHWWSSLAGKRWCSRKKPTTG